MTEDRAAVCLAEQKPTTAATTTKEPIVSVMMPYFPAEFCETKRGA